MEIVIVLFFISKVSTLDIKNKYKMSTVRLSA